MKGETNEIQLTDLLPTNGYCTYRRGKLYFDKNGWIVLKHLAKKTHKSPTYLIHAAIKRYIKLRKTK